MELFARFAINQLLELDINVLYAKILIYAKNVKKKIKESMAILY